MDLREVEASVFLQVCFLISKKYNRVSWSLSSVRSITTPLLIAYVKIPISLYGKYSNFSVLPKSFNISWSQEPRTKISRKVFSKESWFLVNGS